MMNVKDSPWRASGNGAADDQPAIQAAINACAATGGGTVYLPEGVYLIGKPLSWSAPDVCLVGAGATKVMPSAGFVGAAAVVVGNPVNPTYRGGVRDLTVDLGANSNPTLIGVNLVQTWFANVTRLKIVGPNGMPTPTQTAFLMSTPAPGTWSSNNNVFDLQVNGSFLHTVLHQGVVNATNYFGGLGYCTAANKAGSTAVRIEGGDTTRMYGCAFEDYDTGVWVGFQNNGPFDLRLEGCNVPYAAAPGVTFLRLATVAASK